MRRRSALGFLATCGALAAMPRGLRAAGPRFVGERIDLELQEADLDEVLDVFRAVGDVNIVKQADVRAGLITVRFKAVRWDEALFRILDSQGLEMVRDGNILYVCPQR